MHLYNAILFDFDGTLAKTMEDHFQAWQFVLKGYGISLTPEEYYPVEGTSMLELAKTYLKKGVKCGIAPQEIVKKKDDYYLKNYKFELYPGVLEWIPLLSKKIPLGIVTSGLKNRINQSVPKDFLDYFKVLITADDTEQGKPFPDPYLAGAKSLGVLPADCIVIENAPIGIQAAKTAGCHCVAVCSTLKKSYLKDADEVVESFNSLPGLKILKELK